MVKGYRCLVSALLACVLCAPSGVRAQGGDCEGFAVQGVCGFDRVCHFEGSACGAVVGGVTFCAGSCGQGLCMDGTGYVVIGDADVFSRSIIEIECQVRFSQLPGAGEHAAGLVTKYVNHDYTASEWGLFVEGNITPYPTWTLTGDGRQAIRSTAEVLTDVLYCVRAVICGNHGGIYVNGELVATGAISYAAKNTQTPVIVGNAASSGKENKLYGMIDEVRIGCPREPCAPTAVEESTWGAVKGLYK